MSSIPPASRGHAAFEPDAPAPAPEAHDAPAAAPGPARAASSTAAALPDRNAVLAGIGRPLPSASAPNGGLPDTLLRTANATVQHGTDPGDYYCEHIFFTAEREAAKAGSSVVKNASGEKLVGFLHVPPDDFTETTGAKYTQAARHAGTREVVGAALKGYFEDAAAAVKKDPVKLLLTGYGPFMSIKDNPTGDFVAHAENIDGALKAAFGADLLTPKGKMTTFPGGGHALTYRVRDPQTGKERALQVGLDRFAVADGTLDPKNARSIEQAIAAFKPNAVLSMGVAGPGAYLAEHHADDGGMKKTADGGFKHDDAAQPKKSFADNYSLARAILRGSTPPATSQDGGIV